MVASTSAAEPSRMPRVVSALSPPVRSPVREDLRQGPSPKPRRRHRARRPRRVRPTARVSERGSSWDRGSRFVWLPLPDPGRVDPRGASSPCDRRPASSIRRAKMGRLYHRGDTREHTRASAPGGVSRLTTLDQVEGERSLRADTAAQVDGEPPGARPERSPRGPGARALPRTDQPDFVLSPLG
jgi:hypothetical protein